MSLELEESELDISCSERNDEDCDEALPCVEKKKKKKKRKPKKQKGKPESDDSSFPVPSCSLPYLRIHNSSRQGKFAIAAKPISAGTCLLREEPYEFIADSVLCSSCRVALDGTKSFNLDGCQNIYFCSQTCQSYFLEKFESVFCERTYPSYIQQLEEVSRLCDCDTKLLQIVCNILIHFTYDSTDSMNTFYSEVESASGDGKSEGNFVRATRLGCLAQQSHLSDLDESWKQNVMKAFQHLNDLMGLPNNSLVNDQTEEAKVLEALKIAAQVNVNSYGIIVSDNSTHGVREDVGFGLFPVAAMMFNHSCSPNIVNVWNNGRMEYRAVRDIQVGEEIAISYIDVRQDAPSRRRILKETRYFHCMCDRCKAFDLYSMSNDGKARDLDEQTLQECSLGGCYCNKCGPTGIVIAAECTENTHCLNCGWKPSSNTGECENEVTRTVNLARKSLQAIRKLVDVSGSASEPSAVKALLLAIEKWFLEFDPLFADKISYTPHIASSDNNFFTIFGLQHNKPVTMFSPTQLQRYRNSKRLCCRLHPRHYLMIEANRLYASILSVSNERSRAACRLKCGLYVLSFCVPSNYPELMDYQAQLLTSLENLMIDKRVAKKYLQVLRKEMTHLQSSISYTKQILYDA